MNNKSECVAWSAGVAQSDSESIMRMAERPAHLAFGGEAETYTSRTSAAKAARALARKCGGRPFVEGAGKSREYLAQSDVLGVPMEQVAS